jgi:DNA repair protein RadD
MKLTLRKYQEEASAAGLEFFTRKNTKIFDGLEVLPCGTGKSLIIADIAHHLGKGVLCIQPTKELLEQNYNKFIAYGNEASIYSASFDKKEFGDVTFATIQSIYKKGAEFKEIGYKYMVVDEADGFAKGSSGMLNQFRQEAKIRRMLGFTATGFKNQLRVSLEGDDFTKLEMLTKKGKAGKMFQEIVYLKEISEIVEEGWWCPLKYEVFDFDDGLLLYNSTGAEFTEESVEKYYQQQDIHTKIFNRVMESDRDTILVFVPSIKDALELSSLIPDSIAVWGTMPDKDRKKAIEDFRNGSIRVAINVNVLSVGIDIPRISHVILGYPTASLKYIYQWIGRGVRLWEGKEDCIITDFGGNINRYGLMEDLSYRRNSYGEWNLYSKFRQLTENRIDKIRPLVENQSFKVVFPSEFNELAGVEVSRVKRDVMRDILVKWKWYAGNMYVREEILKIIRDSKNK